MKQSRDCPECGLEMEWLGEILFCLKCYISRTQAQTLRTAVLRSKLQMGVPIEPDAKGVHRWIA